MTDEEIILVFQQINLVYNYIHTDMFYVMAKVYHRTEDRIKVLAQEAINKKLNLKDCHESDA
jgi:hypothetical protein